MTREEFTKFKAERDEIIEGFADEFQFSSTGSEMVNRLLVIISTIDKWVTPEKTQEELDSDWFDEKYD